MQERRILVEGATQNDLRAVDVAFGPRLTTVVGPSGSGKSSLVFDVVYHEARRRFMGRARTSACTRPTRRRLRY